MAKTKGRPLVWALALCAGFAGAAWADDPRAPANLGRPPPQDEERTPPREEVPTPQPERLRKPPRDEAARAVIKTGLPKRPPRPTTAHAN